jgi:hypothetical protein
MTYKVVEATPDHSQDIVDVTNDAFLVDAFFKKPEFLDRFSHEDVKRMMAKENSYFFLAVNNEDGAVIGSIYLEVDIVQSELECQVSY